MRVLLEKSSLPVVLDDEPLGKGGEAAVYEVPLQKDMPVLVAKLYHRPLQRHHDKLAAMIANPPVDPMADKGHASIAWPLDRVFSADGQRKFLGFVMPRVQRALPIFEFYNPKSRLQFCPLFHFGYLLQTARNLAAAVRAIHERGYVIGDLNESNLLVNNQALVTVVDTDSFQVPAAGVTFRCPVGKPEYTAPEIQGVNFADIDRGPHHDSFALAAIVFQMLMQGIHPFAGRYTGQGEPGALAERISAGQWPYAKMRAVSFVPNPHAPPWEVLPPQIQALLRRCFEDGHKTPRLRPDARGWQDAVDEVIQQLQTCPANDQHHYHPHAGGCPWCVLAKRQRRDLFPSKQTVEAGLAGARPKRKPRPPAAVATAATAAPLSPAAPMQLGTIPLATQRLVTLSPLPNPRRGMFRGGGDAVWIGVANQFLIVVGVVVALFLLLSRPGSEPPPGSSKAENKERIIEFPQHR